MLYNGSPSEALQMASEVLSVYWELVTTSDAPVDWRCQHEYSESFSSTTELYSESPTPHFTGENFSLRLLQGSVVQTSGGRWTTVCPSLQTVMVGSQWRPLREDRSETCTSLASSSPPSVEEYCSYSLSTVLSHKRYQCFCFVSSCITCALIKFSHKFQPYCNKAGLGSPARLSRGTPSRSTSPPLLTKMVEA